jgi:hypothetical protein
MQTAFLSPGILSHCLKMSEIHGYQGYCDIKSGCSYKEAIGFGYITKYKVYSFRSTAIKYIVSGQQL